MNSDEVKAQRSLMVKNWYKLRKRARYIYRKLKGRYRKLTKRNQTFKKSIIKIRFPKYFSLTRICS